MSYLRYLLVCVQWCPTHMVLCFCFVFRHLLYTLLPVSLCFSPSSVHSVASFSGLSLWYSLTFIYSQLAILYGSIYQIVHGTKGHMAVYGPGCHPQNIIWTEAKLRSIYYIVGDRQVHKLPFGLKCQELFVILYSIHVNQSDDIFLLLYI